MDNDVNIGAVDKDFVKRLPKIELHAHLTGSISTATFHEIWEARKRDDPAFALQDPLTALAVEKGFHDVISFFPLFDKYIYQLCNNLEAVRFATAQVLRDFRDDGVRYLELRTTPRENTAASGGAGFTKEEYVSAVLDTIDVFNDGGTEMAAYLILSVDRRNTPEQAYEVVDLAIRNRHRGVVGVDLCGDPTKNCVSGAGGGGSGPGVGTFGPAFASAKAAGLGLTLHFAEVGPSSSPEELSALLSFGPNRLGHVIHVPEATREEIARRRIALELCLSCNVLAGLTDGGFGSHHFGYWRDKGCPISLCTDDVGIFCSPVSNEYLLAARHFGLNREEVIELVEHAVDSIFGPKEAAARMRKHLEAFRGEMEETMKRTL